MLPQNNRALNDASDDEEVKGENQTFGERLKTEVPREMKPFALWPEDSRLMYKYPLCLKTGNSPIKENRLYLSSENGCLKYWIKTPTGVQSFTMDTKPNRLTIHPNFTLGEIAPFQKRIYDIAKQNNHFPLDENTYEGGVPCEEYPRWSFTRYLKSWFSPSNWWNWFSDRKRFSIPDGKIGLIYDNGKPKFVNSGEYILLSPWSHFDKLVDANALKEHGTTRIIKVGPSQLVYVGNKTTGDFKLLLPGTHILENAASLDIKPVIDPHGKIASIEKTAEELEIEKKALEGERNKIRGGDEKKDVPKPKEPSKLRQLFVNIADGNLGVVYDEEGRMRIWEPGRYYIPPRWYFHCLFSTKQEAELKFDIRIRTNNGTGIEMKIPVQLTYQIPKDKARSVLETYGVGHVIDNLKSTATQEALKQIASNFSQTLLPSFDAAMTTDQAAAIVKNLNLNSKMVQLGIKVHNFAILGMEPADEKVKEALLNQHIATITGASELKTSSSPYYTSSSSVSDKPASFYNHQRQPAYNPAAAASTRTEASAPPAYSNGSGF